MAKDFFAKTNIPWKIDGPDPLVHFFFAADFDEDDQDWLLTCTVEGHYLRALGVEMSILGADNYKSCSEKDKKWQFKEYKGNTVVFRKYIKAAADQDVLSSEISDVQTLVDDYDHVLVSNADQDS